MKYAGLALKLAFLSYLGYLWFFLATSYEPAVSGYSPPVVIFVLDIINLFIHEAGHFIFKLFGMWVHIGGGSLFQCLIPLSLLVVTWRENRNHVVYPAFWLGENLVNVSAYIQDAPVRKLKLIAKGLIHDWHWLLRGNLEMAEPLATTVFITGLVVCAAAIALGLFAAVQAFRDRVGGVDG